METSYGKLSDSEWMEATGLWSRGIDWFVFKVGKKWGVAKVLDAGWPLFKTKTAAYDAVTYLFLEEASNRTAKAREAING